MSEETSTVDTNNNGADQSALVDDFGGKIDYDADFNSEYLNKYKADFEEIPVDENTQTEKTENVVEKQTVQPEKKTIDGHFMSIDGDNSEFDFNKANEFYGKNKDLAFKYEPVFAQEEVKPVVPQQQDNIPEYLKPIMEEKKYKETISSTINQPLNIINDALSKGYLPEDAIKIAQAKIAESVEMHLLERAENSKIEQAKKAYEERLAEQKTQYELNNAKNNELFYANKLGKEQYEKIFFDPKFGGAIVDKLLVLANGGKPIAKDNLGKAWANFASNKNNMAFVYDYAMKSKLVDSLPQVIKASVMAKESQINKQRAMNLGARPSGLVTRPVKTPEKDNTIQRLLGDIDGISSVG